VQGHPKKREEKNAAALLVNLNLETDPQCQSKLLEQIEQGF
jgi:hypothetical protein